MSLLMDALRKAEEAKKKAAREDSSEKAVAEGQQESVVAEKVSKEAPIPAVNLSIEEMEEVPSRSVVPNLAAAIEFEDEDEEDYVLPTSIGAAKDSVIDSDEDLALSPSGEDDAGREPEPEPEPEKIKSNTEVTPKISADAFVLDSFENEDSSASYSEELAPDTEMAKVRDTEKLVKQQSSRVTVKVTEQAHERAKDRDETERRTARRVFAAKKSPLLRNPNAKAVAGSALALVVIAFATYFYISLNEESTFNIPDGRYVATEFVDDGVFSESDEDQLSIASVTVTEAEEAAVVDVVGDAPEQLTLSGGVNFGIGDASVAAPVADTLIESPTLDIADVPVASQITVDSQAETVVEETSQRETITTTIGDSPAVAVESELAVQPVASVAVQPALLVEPINLISFRKQETVAVVDPNVGRAYAAYQRGSLDQAEVLYRQTLASDPRQRDALLGLANITARNGNTTEALDLYSRLLARNPSDPIARAGLIELLPAGSPSEQEAELKRLLSDHPDVAALSYAYGNFLASNQRWSEAQQAYFRALQLAKSDAVQGGLINPDYAFNLAVSLEHLNQSEPAQNYYREALDYSENHPAGFDLTAVRNRLANMLGSVNDE